MIQGFIIKRPIITEKSLVDAAKGVYTFEVSRKASKPEVRRAIEEMFKVKVVDITTSKIAGKKRMVGRKRVKVKESDRKKARVRLAKDQKIELFEVAQT